MAQSDIISSEIPSFFDGKFLKNSAVNIIGTLLSGFLNYLFHIVVSRKMEVAEYGELQSLISLCAIASVFGTALYYFIVKKSSAFSAGKDSSGQKDFFRFFLPKERLIIGGFLLFFLALSPLFFYYLHLKNFTSLLFVALILVFSIESLIYLAVLVGWKDFLFANIAINLSALSKLVFGFLIAQFFPYAWLVISSLFLSAFLGWFISLLLFRKKFIGEPESKEDEEKRKELLLGKETRNELIPVFIFSALSVVIANIDIILVKNIMSSEMTGFYSVLSLFGKMVLWVNMAVIGVFLPSACAENYQGGKVKKKTLVLAYSLILLFSLGAIFVYFLFPDLVISLLFGQKYALFSKELWLFGVFALVFSLLSLESSVSFARQNFRISYVLALVSVLVIFGVYLFHKDIRQVILTIIAAMAVGYFAAFYVNHAVAFGEGRLCSRELRRTEGGLTAPVLNLRHREKS